MCAKSGSESYLEKIHMWKMWSKSALRSYKSCTKSSSQLTETEISVLCGIQPLSNAIARISTNHSISSRHLVDWLVWRLAQMNESILTSMTPWGTMFVTWMVRNILIFERIILIWENHLHLGRHWNRASSSMAVYERNEIGWAFYKYLKYIQIENFDMS